MLSLFLLFYLQLLVDGCQLIHLNIYLAPVVYEAVVSL